MSFITFSPNTTIKSADVNTNFTNIANGTEVGNVSWTAWTTTFGGFSANPTVITRYMVYGKTCHISMYTVSNGTSSTTAFTITLPVAAANVAENQKGVITCVDNGTANIGWIATRQNSTTADLYLGVAGGAWTGTGQKAATFNFTYETV